MKKKKILIVGGGFGGVATALELSKLDRDDIEITLVSNRSHFEYHGALYRLVTGRSPMEICIPLSEIFLGADVKIIKDEISSIDFKKKACISIDDYEYPYDCLVGAVGSETSYFDIPGLKKNSFGFKSIKEALALKNHLHAQFKKAKTNLNNLSYTRIVVVGGGASGVELAAELTEYGKILAISHGINPGNVKVDLIHSKARLIKELPEKMTNKILARLRKLGVMVHLNKKLTRDEVETIYMGDDQIRARTLVWTAGVNTHQLHSNSHRFSFSNNKKVRVDKYLRAVGHGEVFVVGDNSDSKFSGMAQTAIAQGFLVARNIDKLIKGEVMEKYISEKPIYAIPLGRNWAATLAGGALYYGYAGWILRRYLDLKVFRTFLPLRKALRAFFDGQKVCETCPECDVG